MAASIPNCVSYDPTFNYELAVIIHDGIRRMYTDQENVFYYVTVMNENYAHPPMPEGAREGILQGMHRLRQAPKGRKAVPRVQLFGSGTILRESMAAAELLEQDFGVLADLWSVTSYNELARQGREAVRWNRLHPEAAARPVYVSEQLADPRGRSLLQVITTRHTPIRFASSSTVVVTSFLAPTATAEAAPGNSCAGSLKWTDTR